MASRYKQKYIFEKLKEDDEIQNYCKQIELLLQERQSDLNQLQFDIQDLQD